MKEKEYEYKLLTGESLGKAFLEVTYFENADALFSNSLEEAREKGLDKFDTFGIACYDKDKLIGLCGVRYGVNSKIEELSQVYYIVDSHYRRQGIAKRLLVTSILIEKEFHPTTTIHTQIMPRNIASQKTIENLGFYRTGIKYYLDSIPRNQEKYPIYTDIAKNDSLCQKYLKK
ncbi:MAG TPA: GNAT family N-acetyltransferase [Candidatus Fimihabitans intestinipullorum]|uniref:GNAT family N-acetyltransferase n=1 Tax=Candidatus Fimihabitans intestinipullorum TaxID=2840820 RepID=A0A9D1HUT8_9BACT|nr:GNAT family N-acetyltransferase [Candidatus Fimihabitans intestinipullorum]